MVVTTSIIRCFFITISFFSEDTENERAMRHRLNEWLLIDNTRVIGTSLPKPHGFTGKVVKEETSVVVVDLLHRFGSDATLDDLFVDILISRIESNLVMMGLVDSLAVDYNYIADILHLCLEDTISVVKSALLSELWACVESTRVKEYQPQDDDTTIWLMGFSRGEENERVKLL